MNRFWVDEDIIIGETTILKDDNIRHVRALRLFEEDFITLSNGDGFDYKAQIKTIERRKVMVEVLDKKENKNENKIKSVLFQALLKSDNMDLVIQKAVELGVDTIIPIETEHTVALNKNMPHKMKRWEAIMKEACKQCGRSRLPALLDVHTVKEAVETKAELTHLFVAHEDEEVSMVDILGIAKESDVSIGFLIGPEGGWSSKEEEIFKEAKIEQISLGKRILRAETAAIMSLSMVNVMEGLYGKG